MIAESDYADYLEVVFNDLFGKDAVKREFYTKSGRFCDFLVETELITLAIEVENSSEDVVTNGVAQALLYSEELDAAPLVVYPPDKKDNETELDYLSSHVSIVEIPYKF